MNEIQGNKSAGRRWKRLLYAVVHMINYNKVTMYHSIYVNIFFVGTAFYITVSRDYVLGTTNNDESFQELKRFFKRLYR